MAIIIDQQNTSTEDGVWAKFGGSEFKIAHSGNPKFQRALTRLQAPHRRKIEKGTLDPVEGKDIICQAMSEGLILDWRGVIDSKGSEVKFDKAQCRMALKNNDDLREFVQEFSTDLENFRAEEQEQEGNA